MHLFPKIYDWKKRDREFRKKRLFQNEKIIHHNATQNMYDKLIIVPYNHTTGIDDPQTNKILIYADMLAKTYTQQGHRVWIIPVYLVDYLKLLVNQKKNTNLGAYSATNIQQALYDERKYFYKHCLKLGIFFVIPRRTYFSLHMTLECLKEHIKLTEQWFITSTYDVRYRSIASQTVLGENDIQTITKTENIFCIRFFVEGKKDSISAILWEIMFLFGAVALVVHPYDKRYKKIVGKNVLIPIINKPIPIIADEYVDPTKYTGAIVLTPAHDKKHLEIAQKHWLPTDIYAIDDYGFFTCHAGQFAGKNANIFKENIIRFLSDIANLDKIIPIQKQQYISKTTGEILIPMAKRQWFFSLPQHHPFPSNLSCTIIPNTEEWHLINLLYGTKEEKQQLMQQNTKQKKIPDYLTKYIVNQQQTTCIHQENHKQCISKRGSWIPKLPSQTINTTIKTIDFGEIIKRRKEKCNKVQNMPKKQNKKEKQSDDLSFYQKTHIYLTIICLVLRIQWLLGWTFTLENRYMAILQKIANNDQKQKENNFFGEIEAYMQQYNEKKPDWRDTMQQIQHWTKEQIEHICTLLEVTWGIKYEQKNNMYMFDREELLGISPVSMQWEDCFDSTWLATLQTHLLIKQFSNNTKTKQTTIHLLSSQETLYFTTSFFQYNIANPYLQNLYIHHVDENKYTTKPLVWPRLQTTAADCIRIALLLPYSLSNENNFWTKEEFFLQKLRNATRYITSKINRWKISSEDFFVAIKALWNNEEPSDTIKRILTRWQKVLEDYKYREQKCEMDKWFSILIQFIQYEFCDIFLEHSKQEFFEKKEKLQEMPKKNKKKTINVNENIKESYDVFSSPIFIIISYILKQILQHLYPLAPYITSNLWYEWGCKEPIRLKLPYSLPETIKKNFKYALLMEIMAQWRKRYTLASPRGQECILYIQANKDFLLFTQSQEKKIQPLTKNTTIVYIPEWENLPEHMQEIRQIVNITIGYYIAPQDQKRASDVDPELLEKELEEKEQLLQKIRFILTTIKPHEVLMKKEYEKKFEEVKKEIEQLEYEMKRQNTKKK